MVSRYVVDDVIIGGFLLGMLGALYLGRGVFALTGSRLLCRVLVSAPMVALLVVFLWVSIPLVFVALTMHVNPPRIERLQVTAPYVGEGLGLALAAVSFKDSAFERVLSPQMVKQVMAFSAFVAGVALSATVLLPLWVMGPAFQPGGLYLLAILPLFILMPPLQGFSSRLPSRLDVVLGILLILVGIAALVLPPVLDLLGIKVV